MHICLCVRETVNLSNVCEFFITHAYSMRTYIRIAKWFSMTIKLQKCTSLFIYYYLFNQLSVYNLLLIVVIVWAFHLFVLLPVWFDLFQHFVFIYYCNFQRTHLQCEIHMNRSNRDVSVWVCFYITYYSIRIQFCCISVWCVRIFFSFGQC